MLLEYVNIEYLQNMYSSKLVRRVMRMHCPKFKAEFRIRERSVDEMKLDREKYSGDFFPYNLPELFQGSEKLEKFTWARTHVLPRLLTTRLRNTCVDIYFLRYTSSVAQDFLTFVGKHIL
jgi:hypothetical protein